MTKNKATFVYVVIYVQASNDYHRNIVDICDTLPKAKKAQQAAIARYVENYKRGEFLPTRYKWEYNDDESNDTFLIEKKQLNATL